MSTPNFVGFWMRIDALYTDPIISDRTYLLLALQNAGVGWVTDQKN